MVARRLGRLHRPGIRVCGAGLVGPTQPTDFVGRLTRRLGRLHRPSVRMCGAGLVGPTQPTDFVGRLARIGWVGFIDPAFGCAELGWWGQPSLRISRPEEHTSELQSLMRISYAVFCLKKKKTNGDTTKR